MGTLKEHRFQADSFNRTIVELKLVMVAINKLLKPCFNRTIVELKFSCSLFNQGFFLWF